MLTTNLPVSWGSSIFLRVDETRVDIIKALITGPEGTPYVYILLRELNVDQCTISGTTMVGAYFLKSLWQFSEVTSFSFLFDIFLGSNYNQTPPVVKYMTVCVLYYTNA